MSMTKKQQSKAFKLFVAVMAALNTQEGRGGQFYFAGKVGRTAGAITNFLTDNRKQLEKDGTFARDVPPDWVYMLVTLGNKSGVTTGREKRPLEMADFRPDRFSGE